MANEAHPDQFIDKVLTEIRGCEEQDAHLVATLQGIEAQRTTIKEKIDKYNISMETYAALMNVELMAPPESPAIDLTKYGDMAGLSVADACESILQIEGGRCKTIDVIEVLEAAKKVNGRSRNSNYGTVAGAMERDPRFVKVEAGEWALKGPDGLPLGTTPVTPVVVQGGSAQVA